MKGDKITMKRNPILFLLVFVSLVLAACGPATQPSEPPAKVVSVDLSVYYLLKASFRTARDSDCAESLVWQKSLTAVFPLRNSNQIVVGDFQSDGRAIIGFSGDYSDEQKAMFGDGYLGVDKVLEMVFQNGWKKYTSTANCGGKYLQTMTFEESPEDE